MKIEEIRKFYDDYLGRLKDVNNRHKRIFQSLYTYVPKNCNVLDIGCGAGLTSHHLADGGRNVVAVDLSSVLIDYAKKHNSHEKIQYIVADITKWSSISTFDFIVMVDVLEHIEKESIEGLFHTIDSVSNEKTSVYLNIPSSYTMDYLYEHHPDALQIVDNSYTINQVLNMFKGIGYIPIFMTMYWMQYIEYIFNKKEYVDSYYSKIFNGLKEI